MQKVLLPLFSQNDRRGPPPLGLEPLPLQSWPLLLVARDVPQRSVGVGAGLDMFRRRLWYFCFDIDLDSYNKMLNLATKEFRSIFYS